MPVEGYPATAGMDNAEKSGAYDDSESLRFKPEEVVEFEASRQSRIVNAGFLLLALSYMWPYQTMVQTQNFLTMKFPEEALTVGNVMMNCTTWPFLIMHLLMTFTGFSRRLPYTCKIVVPSFVTVAVALYLIVTLASVSSVPFLLNSLYASGILLAAIPQGIMEPASVDMAGLFPSALTSKNVMTGNGLCGLLVSSLNIATRLASHGFEPIDLDSAQQLTFVFFAIMAVVGVSAVVVYLYMVRRSPYYSTYVKKEHKSPADEDEDEGGGGDGVRDGGAVSAALEAIRYVWPSVLSLAIVYITTLGLWPVLPGTTCINSDPTVDTTLKSWWFDIILFTFNFADFLSKSEPYSLKWGAEALSPKMHLICAVVRALIFFPLILYSSAPQSYDPLVARWVVLGAVFLLGISNGFLTTIIFMRGPKALPSDSSNQLAEQASTLLVTGLYFGIAFGCLVAYELGKLLPMGECFS